ncbi:MAG TPA: hypothetical protein PKL77_06140 [Candidatus Omnitrophota bacterium]|nr:hypothetical protein [Candidatus Omnitrophota bacterium]
MNAKNIGKSLKRKMDDWVKNISDDDIKKIIKENALITGGALVSLLIDEEPHDYDVYFKTFKSCEMVARYYTDVWNKTHPEKNIVEIKVDEAERITAYIQSAGIAAEDGETGIDDNTEPDVVESEEEQKQEKPKYRPRYFSTNAISLSDGIQLVIRFYGDVSEIHTNYDFIHCTCSYDYQSGEVNLPSRALESIINKELYYTGSKYPLCSIIRSRKFIARGWTINAGQYLKMCLQLNELDLKDLNVFADQLVGVDSAYFSAAIEQIKAKQEKEPDFKIDNTYLFEIINRIF